MTTRTYWLSKYALSDGRISAVEGAPFGDSGKYISAIGCCIAMSLGRDIHETKAEAIKAADAARIKKIASLRKQITRLEALKFEE